MYWFISIIILFICHSIECNSRPFYCQLLLNETNGRFEGIQVFTKWFPKGKLKINQKQIFDNKLLMYRTDLGKEWEFKLVFNENGTAIDIEFIENTTKRIPKDILNRFSFNDYNESESYDCIVKNQVFF